MSSPFLLTGCFVVCLYFVFFCFVLFLHGSVLPFGKASDSGVVVRCYCHEFGLDAVADIECLYEFVDCFLCHVLVGACECFKCLVRVRIGFAAQYGLYGFCHHCPCVVEVGCQLLFVEYKLAQSFECALHCNHSVTERHAYVTEYSRVGKVALQAAYGQLLCEELQHCVGYAEVAFAVFEVDGVHLVRHCA